MKKGKLLSGFALAAGILISACAQPEEELLLEDQGITTAPNTVSSSEAITEDVTSDNGRHIQETYGNGDFSFKMDADVYVSDKPVQSGTLSVKEINIGLVEKYLCDGEKLIQGSNPYEYVSSGNSIDNALDYDIRFSVSFDDPGTAHYENWRMDQYYSGPSFQYYSAGQWEDTDQELVTLMQKKTEELFKNLELEAAYNGANVAKSMDGSVAENNCYINMTAMLDGFPLISLSMNDYMTSICHIGERGVNSIQLDGLFQKDEANPAAVLSLDDTLAIVKKGVEEKNINTYDKTITDIDLAYAVNFADQKPSFFPVWCFSSRWEEAGITMPLLCINAQTGSVAYMSR